MTAPPYRTGPLIRCWGRVVARMLPQVTVAGITRKVIREFLAGMPGDATVDQLRHAQMLVALTDIARTARAARDAEVPHDG